MIQGEVMGMGKSNSCYPQHDGKKESGVDNIFARIICTLTRPRMFPYEDPKLSTAKERILGAKSCSSGNLLCR